MKRNQSGILYPLIVVANYDCCLTLEGMFSAKKLDSITHKLLLFHSISSSLRFLYIFGGSGLLCILRGVGLLEFLSEALLSFSDICNNTDAHRNSKECQMGFLRLFAYKVFQYIQKFNMRNLEFITKACGIIRTGDAVCFNKASIAAAAAAAAITLPSHSLVSCSVIMGLTTM